LGELKYGGNLPAGRDSIPTYGTGQVLTFEKQKKTHEINQFINFRERSFTFLGYSAGILFSSKELLIKLYTVFNFL
jgi:hypothetical protein